MIYFLAITLMSILMVLLIRFTILRNEYGITRNGCFLILVVVIFYGWQGCHSYSAARTNTDNRLKIDSLLGVNKSSQGKIDTLLQTNKKLVEQNSLATLTTRPNIKLVLSKIEWIEDGRLNFCIINEGCRSGSVLESVTRTVAIRNDELTCDNILYDNSLNEMFKYMANHNISTEECCQSYNGGNISKKNSFLVDFSLKYEDDITKKHYEVNHIIYYNKEDGKIHQSAPAYILDMYQCDYEE